MRDRQHAREPHRGGTEEVKKNMSAESRASGRAYFDSDSGVSLDPSETAAMADRLSGDPKLFGEILTGFAARLPDERRQFRQFHETLARGAIDCELLEAIRSSGQRLAGTCAVLGFSHLAERARSVEAACRMALASHHPDASIVMLASALGALIHTIVTAS
jgi:HPt (histidine-containing phosphotransfer) domain-containing protein